jgi:hypothetical protein
MSMTFIFAALMASTLTAETPVIISDLVTGPASHVRVTNTARQPVTAWSVAASTETSDGRVHREVYTTDGYLSELTHGLPRAAARLERLMPGESRDLPLDPLPEGAKADVIAAVLDDGTAMGEEAVVGSIFAARVKERDALKAVTDVFGAVLPTLHGAAALTALKEQLTALSARGDSVPCHAALDAVQAYQLKGDEAQVDQSLRTYADFVRREYELAAKHSQRRQS